MYDLFLKTSTADVSGCQLADFSIFPTGCLSLHRNAPENMTVQ